MRSHLLLVLVIALIGPSLAQNATWPTPTWNTTCGPQVEFAQGNLNHDAKAVYNVRNDEFFVVYVEQFGKDQETELIGMRISPTNLSVIQSVDLAGPDNGWNFSIANPSIAYNVRNNTYVVVFEYELNGIWTLYSMVVYPNLTIAQTQFVGENRYHLVTRDPRVIYNPTYNQYLLVSTVFFTGPGGEQTSGLGSQVLGVMGQTIGLTTTLSAGYTSTGGQVVIPLRKPDLAYNPDFSNAYLVVCEGNFGGEDDILGADLAPNGLWGGQYIYDLVETTNNNGTIIFDETNPQIAYSTDSDQFLVAWEINYSGENTNTASETDVAVMYVTADAYSYDFVSIGLDNADQLNRNPSVSYNWRTNNFVVSFDSSNQNTGISDVRMAFVPSNNITGITEIYQVNSLARQEYFPSFATDTRRNRYMMFWNHGNDTFATTKNPTTVAVSTRSVTTQALTTQALTTQALTTGALTTQALTTAAITTQEVTTGSTTGSTTASSTTGSGAATTLSKRSVPAQRAQGKQQRDIEQETGKYTFSGGKRTIHALKDDIDETRQIKRERPTVPQAPAMSSQSSNRRSAQSRQVLSNGAIEAVIVCDTRPLPVTTLAVTTEAVSTAAASTGAISTGTVTTSTVSTVAATTRTVSTRAVTLAAVTTGTVSTGNPPPATTTTTSGSAQTAQNSPAVSAGGVAAIVIILIAVAIAAVVIGYFLWKRHKRQQNNSKLVQAEMELADKERQHAANQ